MTSIDLTAEEQVEINDFLISLYPIGRTTEDVFKSLREVNPNWGEDQAQKYARLSFNDLVNKKLCKKGIGREGNGIIILTSLGQMTARKLIGQYYNNTESLPKFIKILNKLIHTYNDKWAIQIYKKLLAMEVTKTLEIFSVLRTPQYFARFLESSAKLLEQDINDKKFIETMTSHVTRLHKLGLISYKNGSQAGITSNIIAMTDVGEDIYFEVIRGLKNKATTKPSETKKEPIDIQPFGLTFLKYFVMVSLVSLGIALILEAIMIGVPISIAFLYPCLPIGVFFGGIYMEKFIEWIKKRF